MRFRQSGGAAAGLTGRHALSIGGKACGILFLANCTASDEFKKKVPKMLKNTINGVCKVANDHI